MRKPLILLACILFPAIGTFAQRNLGVATSDWGSMNSIFLNPASIAGSHEKIAVSILSINVGIDNNLGTFTSISNISKINSSDSNSTKSIFSNSGRQQFSMVVPSLDMHGPGVMVSINNKMSVALTTRVRVVNQLNNFDQSLYRQVTNPDTPSGNVQFSSKNFNWTAHLWSEIGLSFAMVAMDNDIGQIKVGATLRHLSGVGYLGLKGKNMNLKYTAGNKDSFYAANTDLEFASNIVSSRSAVFSGINASSLFGNLFGASQGGGFGADLGVIYTRTLYFGSSNKDDNGHKIMGSASIMDIGAVTYKNTNSTLNITGNGYLSGQKIKDYKGNIDSIKAYAVRQGFTADTGNEATKVHMPTALIVSGDYQVYKHFFVNATYIANLVNRQLVGNSVYNQLTITPRFDTHVFTVGVPITYSALANDMKVGLGLRVGGFFLGSDDMLALMSNNQYGFNFYIGGYVPIRKKQHKDETLHTME